MRTVSFTKLLNTTQIVLIVLAAGALAGAKDEAIRLDPYEVKTRPFARWGFEFEGSISIPNLVIGGPMNDGHVTAVYHGSPAEAAGVQLGDEIEEIDGRPISEVSLREIRKRYGESETGDIVSFSLFNRAALLSRKVEFKLVSDRGWSKGEMKVCNCWGVLFSAKGPVNFNITCLSRKPKGDAGRLKFKRRSAMLSRGGTAITLIERENGMVEMLSSKKIPKFDDVEGRLLQSGARIVLFEDGRIEVVDAPQKFEEKTVSK